MAIKMKSRTQNDHPTILVVEDNSAILELFASVLRESGFNVYTAGNVEEALRIGLHQSGNIDLLLTDVVLPSAPGLHLKRGPSYRKEMSGLDLFRQLKVKRPHLRALFISGQPEDHLKSLGVSKDTCTLLRKPLVPETLLKAVRGAFQPQPFA